MTVATQPRHSEQGTGRIPDGILLHLGGAPSKLSRRDRGIPRTGSDGYEAGSGVGAGAGTWRLKGLHIPLQMQDRCQHTVHGAAESGETVLLMLDCLYDVRQLSLFCCLRLVGRLFCHIV
jgi:hypothetical protein